MKTKVISVRVPEEIEEKLIKIATEKGKWTTSELVKEWIQEKIVEWDDIPVIAKSEEE